MVMLFMGREAGVVARRAYFFRLFFVAGLGFAAWMDVQEDEESPRHRCCQ